MSRAEMPDVYLSSVRTPLDAHNEAMSLPLSEVVQQLTDLLGATTVAEIGGVKETRAVQQWLAGVREPQRPHELRFALQLALMISTIRDRELARAWFHGANPGLADRVPIVLLRDGPLEEFQVPLMSAARSFAGRDGA
jgi:hypothetical protein